MTKVEKQQQLADAFVGVMFREFTYEALAEVAEVGKLYPVCPETTALNTAFERELERRKERES